MPNLSYLSPKTAMHASPIEGRGLFAVEPIRKGEIVAIEGGYIFNHQTWRDIEKSLGPADIPKHPRQTGGGN